MSQSSDRQSELGILTRWSKQHRRNASVVRLTDLRVVLVIETLIGFLQLPDYPFRVVVQDLPHSREVSLFLLQRVFSRC